MIRLRQITKGSPATMNWLASIIADAGEDSTLLDLPRARNGEIRTPNGVATSAINAAIASAAISECETFNSYLEEVGNEF